MPQSIGELINNLAIKAGMKADDPNLVSLLSSPDLQKITVPDELVTTIDRGLLNIDDARNNHPVIKNKYFADAYDGLDKFLLTLIQDDTFDETELAEIKAEKSTQKKIQLIHGKLKAKASASPNKEDKTETNKKIAELNEQVRLAKEGGENIKKEYEGKIKNIHLDSNLNALFGNYKTIYDEMPDIKNVSLKAIVQKALQDNNAEFSINEAGQLVLVGKDGTNVFGSDNRQLTPQSLLDKSFAPILKVHTGPKQNGVTIPGQLPKPTEVIPGKGGAEAATENFKSLAQQQIANLEAATGQKMM